MRKATRTVATVFGLLAGAAGLEHGIFEIMQGNARPGGLMFPSMGPPCVAEKIWNACEPAMSVIPSFLVSGVLTLIISLAVLGWAIGFVQRKNGGAILILLCIVLLLMGGGFFPPLIGIIGGIAGIKINAPLGEKPVGGVWRFLGKLWPWPLVIFVVWILGQWVVGYFFNDFLMKNMGLGVLLILALLPVSVLTAYGHDVEERERAN
jgi:hypothetical protein